MATRKQASVWDSGTTVFFGETEEKARLKNMGCNEREHLRFNRWGVRPCDWQGLGRSSEGRVLYHDAIPIKRHQFDLLLHETLGGSFSPPALKQLHKHAIEEGGRRGGSHAIHGTPPHLV